MQTQNIPNLAVGENYALESVLNADSNSSQETLESIEHRIAERKFLEYRNIEDLERMRQKLEECVNSFYCFTYNANPRILTTLSKLQSEMIRLDMRKNDEMVNAFRDVERLEAEKRNILGDIREDSEMSTFSGGFQ